MVGPLKLKPVFKERVWGGHRLQPDSAAHIGEAWIVYEGCEIDGGDQHGQTLGVVAEQTGMNLLGERVVERTGSRFPLLIKLLHSTEWLSVQVHPDDEQAKILEGHDEFGKTEAWHVIDAEPGARVVYGFRSGWNRDEVEQRIRQGTLEEALNFRPVTQGDTLFTPAGCVHAIGPGLFIYEVQQTSDITYRLYDWNRPASAGRSLHLDKGLAVLGECLGGEVGQSVAAAEAASVLASCSYFALERIDGASQTVPLDTEERSFHSLTVTTGTVKVIAAGAELTLGELETVVIPAVTGRYQVEPLEPFSALLSRVP